MPQRELRSCPKIALDNNRPLASNVFILCICLLCIRDEMCHVDYCGSATSVYECVYSAWPLKIVDFEEDDNFSGGVYFSGNHKNTQWEHFQTEVRPAIIFSLCDDGSFLHGAAICEM